MKTTLFHCILVVPWRFQCYAENLESFTIIVGTGQYKKCQQFLLVQAGAIHVEEIEAPNVNILCITGLSGHQNSLLLI